MNWVDFHQDNPSVETVDIEKCRSLFEQLNRARIPVSFELEPPKASSGALFAGPWDEQISHLHCDDGGNVLNRNLPLQGNGVITSVTHNLGRQPKKQISQRRFLATIMLNHFSRYYGMPTRIDDQPLRTVSIDLAALRHNGRLWREAEHTALLLQRILVDFLRLSLLALYIPADLYSTQITIRHSSSMHSLTQPGNLRHFRM